MIGQKNGWNIVNNRNNQKHNKLKQYLVKFIFIGILVVISICSNLCFAAPKAVKQNNNIHKDELVAKEVLIKDSCIDAKPKCVDKPNTGTRTVDNIEVKQECWKYEYSKNCSKVASKNDCKNIDLDKFNLIKDICLTKTKIGEQSFCLNTQKTFLSTTKNQETIVKSKIVMDPDNKGALKNLLCSTLCLDGNCPSVFKDSQEDNKEMVSAIAQLEMLSKVKEGMTDPKQIKFNIFSANLKKCHNKTGIHSNCCSDTGFLKSAGLVNCPVEQKILATEVRKGRCEDVGEYCAKEVLGKCIRKTKSYCCFPTVLAKVIHKGARAQLKKNLGSAKNPQCGGLTIDELKKIDFSKIDFKDFFELELQTMMKGNTSDDNQKLIKRSFPNGNSNLGKNSFPKMSEDGVIKKRLTNAENLQ